MKAGGIVRVLGALAVIAVASLASAESAAAQQLVYRPTNPAFGGNPLNQQWLLSVAQAQKPTETVDPFQRDPLQDFQQGLQRQILSSISREIVTSQFGGDVDLSQQGRYNLGDFIIEVIPGLSGVDILVINTLTGDQTTVTVPNF